MISKSCMKTSEKTEKDLGSDLSEVQRRLKLEVTQLGVAYSITKTFP